MWLKNRDLNPPLGRENVRFYIILSETIRGEWPIYLINDYSVVGLEDSGLPSLSGIM